MNAGFFVCEGEEVEEKGVEAEMKDCSLHACRRVYMYVHTLCVLCIAAVQWREIECESRGYWLLHSPAYVQLLFKMC